jgi:hypothetical protein
MITQGEHKEFKKLLKEFQSKNGLTPDATIGPETMRVFNENRFKKVLLIEKRPRLTLIGVAAIPENDDIQYFKDMLYRSLRIPPARFFE